MATPSGSPNWTCTGATAATYRLPDCATTARGCELCSDWTCSGESTHQPHEYCAIVLLETYLEDILVDISFLFTLAEPQSCAPKPMRSSTNEEKACAFTGGYVCGTKKECHRYKRAIVTEWGSEKHLHVTG